MKVCRCLAIVLLCVVTAPTVQAQELDLNQFSRGNAPAAQGDAPQGEAPAAPPEGVGPPRAAAGAAAARGLATTGYQFAYGSFEIYPHLGNPAWAYGIMAFSHRQYPNPPRHRLYGELLDYWGYGPGWGYLFEGDINGHTLYVLFGDTNLGMQGGVPLRRVTYYDARGYRIFSTCARYYAPW